jgi:hypothetical protein
VTVRVRVIDEERTGQRTKARDPKGVIPDLVRDPVKRQWLVCFDA